VFSDDYDDDGQALDIGVSEREGRWTFRLRGELDIQSAPSLERALDEAPAGAEVVLDLRGLAFIDSSGLRAILGRRRRIREAGGQLRLVRGANVQRFFDVVGMTPHLEFVEADSG
jgi:anti-anti-sigma factor